MTTIATQQPDALDATNGGTYTPAGALTINPGSAWRIDPNLTFGGTNQIVNMNGTNARFEIASAAQLPTINHTAYAIVDMNAHGITALGGGSDWTFSTTSGWVQQYVNTGGGSDPSFMVPISGPTPQEGALTELRVYYIAPGGSAPSRMGTIQAFRMNGSGSIVTNSATQAFTIPQASQSSVALSTFTDDNLDHSADPDPMYVQITGEGGTSSSAGRLKIVGIRVTYTATILTPG